MKNPGILPRPSTELSAKLETWIANTQTNEGLLLIQPGIDTIGKKYDLRNEFL